MKHRHIRLGQLQARQWGQVWWRFLVSLLIGSLLIGCSQKNELTLYKGQEWLFKSSFTYNPDEIPTMGFSLPIFEGLSLDANTSLLNPAMTEMMFDEMVAQYRQSGFDVSWRKQVGSGGDVTYILEGQGVGWEHLTDLLDGTGANEFDLPTPSIEITELGDGTVQFMANFPSDPYGFSALLLPTTMQVSGGRILQSNAHEVRGGTAVWRNPTGTIEATLTPATPPTQLLLIAGGATLVVLLAGGSMFFLWRLRGGTSYRPPGRSPVRRTPPPPRKSRSPKRPPHFINSLR